MGTLRARRRAGGVGFGLLVGAALVLGLSAVPLKAQTTSTWLGGSGNWSNPLNWSDGVPNGSFNAVIDQGTTPQTVTLNMNATVNDLTVGGPFESNLLDVAPGDSLTISGVFSNYSTVQVESNSSLTLESYGSMTNYGRISVNDGGTVTLVSAAGAGGFTARGGISLNSSGGVATLRLDGENATFSSENSAGIFLSDSP
jgi:hypothetical protein